MIIYSDLITGDELFSDSYPMTEIMEGMIYRLQGKRITQNLNVNVDIGANPSAEGGGEDEGAVDEGSVSGVDIVLAHRLQEVPFDKKSFQKSLKDWCGKVLKTLQEKNPDRAVVFKEKLPQCVKELMKDFDEYQFYVGENMEPDCGPVLVKWEGSDPIMYVFKDGVTEQKF